MNTPATDRYTRIRYETPAEGVAEVVLASAAVSSPRTQVGIMNDSLRTF